MIKERTYRQIKEQLRLLPWKTICSGYRGFAKDEFKKKVMDLIMGYCSYAINNSEVISLMEYCNIKGEVPDSIRYQLFNIEIYIWWEIKNGHNIKMRYVRDMMDIEEDIMQNPKTRHTYREASKYLARVKLKK